ncbi:MAG: hypothetical protein ACTSR2_01815 [Candidatus Hodarchaeales archaeon]
MDKPVAKLWQRILRLWRENQWQVRFFYADSLSGYIDWLEETIWLDPRKDLMVTFLHECLHIIYPKDSEDMVEGKTKLIVYQITPRQFKTLLKKLYESLA